MAREGKSKKGKTDVTSSSEEEHIRKGKRKLVEEELKESNRTRKRTHLKEEAEMEKYSRRRKMYEEDTGERSRKRDQERLDKELRAVKKKISKWTEKARKLNEKLAKETGISEEGSWKPDWKRERDKETFIRNYGEIAHKMHLFVKDLCCSVRVSFEQFGKNLKTKAKFKDKKWTLGSQHKVVLGVMEKRLRMPNMSVEHFKKWWDLSIDLVERRNRLAHYSTKHFTDEIRDRHKKDLQDLYKDCSTAEERDMLVNILDIDKQKHFTLNY